MFKIVNKLHWKEISINIFGKEFGVFMIDNIEWEEDLEYLEYLDCIENYHTSMVKWWDHIGKYLINYHKYI